MDKYPVYFEVTLYCDGEESKEGGFIFADSWADAAHQLEDTYKDDLVSLSIEMYDNYALCMSIEEARKIKEIVENA